MGIMLHQVNALPAPTLVKLVNHPQHNVYHVSMAIYLNQLVLYPAHHLTLRTILTLSANPVS